MLFPENFFLFREKYDLSGKFFGISGKFFGVDPPPPPPPPPPVDNFSVKQFLDALFFRKVPLKACPPQLLEASYAPVLLLLVTGQRGQTIHCLSLSEMTLGETSFEFQVLEHMKTSKPGSGTTILKIEQYTPILVLREYLKRTKSVRGDNKQLFVSYQKPYQPVPRDTISRWVKVVLIMLGLTPRYTQHTVLERLPHRKLTKVYHWTY
jgi:hypothetical protein